MPFTSEDLAIAGKAALDFHAKGVTDQIAIERPLLKALQAGKKPFPGSKEFVTERARKSYDSNFQWFRGDQAVSYRRKDTLAELRFSWSSAHDGFTMSEDELTQNGIILTDDRSATPTEAEKIQLVNIMKERQEALDLGFEEMFDFELHLDGSQNPESVPGLDHLISLTPTVGVVGGIDRSIAANAWFRNYAKNSISTATPGNLMSEMDIAWRATIRNGGRPNLILMGADFFDALRKETKGEINRQVTINGSTPRLDAGVQELAYNRVPAIYNPVYDEIDAKLSPVDTWSKRCYFINTRFLHLRPAEGHDMITRRPPRVYNRYAHYWGKTWKGALTLTRANAHAVLRIA